MSIQDYNYLQELQPKSRVFLPEPVVALLQSQEEPRKLVRKELIANMKFVTKPRQDITKRQGQVSIRKVKTFLQGGNQYEINCLNAALLGGKDYPVLTAVLGTAAGVASFNAGLLFTAATTAISLAKKNKRILARAGDEIWHSEEIGKIRNGVAYKPIYVSSFLLVDPFRFSSHTKGWLIHEERFELTV